MRAIIANFVKGVVRLWLATENVNKQLGKLGFIYPKTFVLESNMKPLEVRTVWNVVAVAFACFSEYRVV